MCRQYTRFLPFGFTFVIIVKIMGKLPNRTCPNESIFASFGVEIDCEYTFAVSNDHMHMVRHIFDSGSSLGYV